MQVVASVKNVEFVIDEDITTVDTHKSCPSPSYKLSSTWSPCLVRNQQTTQEGGEGGVGARAGCQAQAAIKDEEGARKSSSTGPPSWQSEVYNHITVFSKNVRNR